MCRRADRGIPGCSRRLPSAPGSAVAVQRIRHEVQAPALVRPVGQHHWRARAQRPFPTAPLADRQPLLVIQPKQLLVIHGDPFAVEQGVQSPIPEPAPLSRQLPQTGTRCLVVRTARRIAPRLRIDTDQSARTALRVTLLRNSLGRSISPQAGRHEFFASSSFSVETSITLSAKSRRASDTSMLPYFDRQV